MVHFLSLLPLLTALFAILPSALAAPHFESGLEQSGNLTERTFGLLWNTHKCARVAGDWNNFKYDFGCLCLSDLDAFCQNNGINNDLKRQIDSYITNHGLSHEYPNNAQPLCGGSGDYNCGSLPRNKDGTCGQTTCPSNKCSTNGGCCPRGQTYRNGKCCGRVGILVQYEVCTPAFQCTTGEESNGVCCPTGWKGYEQKYCCPSGQYGQNGQCVCPAGQTKNGDKCQSVCKNAGEKWWSTKCCPSGSTEKNGQCICNNAQQTLKTINGVSSCVNRCSKSGWTFGNTVCCPAGSVEDGSTGTCKCTSNQQRISGSGDNQHCVNKCSGDQTFSIDKCCPAGSAQLVAHSDCKCTTWGQTLQTVNGVQKCVEKCPLGQKFGKTICCPAHLTENDSGNCVCADDAYKNIGSYCVPKCLKTQTYNYNTRQCESVCDESAGYHLQVGWKGNNMCCKKDQIACNNVCCPIGKEEIGNSGICCKKGSKVESGKCVEPTGVSIPKRRALAGRFDINGEIIFEPTANAYGLEENKNGKLCPASLAACPIPGRGEYECLDTSSELQSCGGCTTLGHGMDCTQIPGARWMGCNSGKCEVYSCVKGWKLAPGGTECVQIK